MDFRRVIVAAIVMTMVGTAAADPSRITVGIYAPSIEFGTAQARLMYVQALAQAIQQRTGIETRAQSYGSLGALEKDNVDFAIIDAPCYAQHLGWRLLAAANIGGGTSRAWALFSSTGGNMTTLRGKTLAFMQTGCDDAGFVDNAMLASEVAPGYFGARDGKSDLAAAVAEVVSYKAAQAVFAPIGTERGLHKVFDTGSVPNPAFVALSTKLPGTVVDQVAAAVLGFGGGGAIASWSRGTREAYQELASRLARVVKTGIFAAPEPVHLDAKAVLVDPSTIRDPAPVPVRQHFIHPGARLD